MLDNTELKLLWACRHGATALECFNQLYKSSGQPATKVRGISKKLARLATKGYLDWTTSGVGNDYTARTFRLTIRGRQAGAMEATKRRSFAPARFPRLAGQI